jgi:alkanesulfonate monooxygenase SsuD/methylene tetrahydromethanopterin reductase-like flavin-dependent oxidoreductase (luciferase family)
MPVAADAAGGAGACAEVGSTASTRRRAERRRAREEERAAMKVSMTLPVMEPGLDRARLKAWVRSVEDGPWHSLAMGERIAFVNPELMTLLGACAVLSERVQLVTTVVIAPMHDPVWLAKQLASVDVLSGGRLSVGLGVGGREEDYRAVAADPGARTNDELARRARRLRDLWSGAPIGDGIDRALEPAPTRPGGPELLAGALGPRAIAKAARWADGLSGFSWGPDPHEIETAFARAREAWQALDRPAPRLSVGFWFAAGEDPRAQIGGHLRRYLSWLPASFVDSVLPTTGFAGDGAALRALLDEIEALGADEVFLVPTSIDEAQVERVAGWLG